MRQLQTASSGWFMNVILLLSLQNRQVELLQMMQQDSFNNSFIITSEITFLCRINKYGEEDRRIPEGEK